MKNPKYLPLLLASAALFGCTVGPRFEPPAVAIPQRYIGQVSDAASDLGWWKLFNDTTLVRLVSTALRNNRNIAVALSRVEQARLTLKATKASLGPSVGYGLDAQYGTESYVGLTTDKPEQSYMIKPTISWEVDLFGKIRRMSEADRAQMLATDRAAQGVMVSLAAEVATTYFDYLQYEYAEYISRSTLRSREDTYRLMESSYRAGTINEMELSQSRAAVATAQAAIPRFERARQQALHALSLLLGQNPSDDLIGRHASLAELDMPEEIPAGLPSDLLERKTGHAGSLLSGHGRERRDRSGPSHALPEHRADSQRRNAQRRRLPAVRQQVVPMVGSRKPDRPRLSVRSQQKARADRKGKAQGKRAQLRAMLLAGASRGRGCADSRQHLPRPDRSDENARPVGRARRYGSHAAVPRRT